jgi:hypothetical protein
MADKKAYDKIQKEFPEMKMDWVMKRVKARVAQQKRAKKKKKK